MALKGNLRDFTLTQLLNLINLSKKTGMLVIEAVEERAQLAFRDGKLAYANLGAQPVRLPAVLRSGNYINKAQYRILVERTGNMTDKEIGLMLINAGYGSQDEIFNQVQQFYLRVVRRLFTWLEGDFHFEAETLPVDDVITTRIDLEDLIMEGSRQLHEREQMQGELPDLDVCLRFSEKPEKDFRKVNLSMEEWRVVSYINPKNSIRQISRAVKLNDLEIRRVVLALMQAGMVEVVRPEIKPINQEKMFHTKDRKEQRSLVNRIIARLRSL
jgi:hypothetical protein